jgi:hypothetical protein
MAKPGGTTARGYGAKHQAERAKVKRLVDSGQAHCWRCGGWVDPARPWDLGHDDHDRSVYRGPEHVKCNRATSRYKRARRIIPTAWTSRRW